MGYFFVRVVSFVTGLLTAYLSDSKYEHVNMHYTAQLVEIDWLSHLPELMSVWLAAEVVARPTCVY